MNKNLKLLLFVIASAFIGVVNGVFGGGGGLLCVPLFKLLGMEDKEAHATTVLTMAIISIPTIIVYITTISINWFQTLFLTVGVLTGGLIGSKLLKNVNNETLNVLFVLLILVAGIKMLF